MATSRSDRSASLRKDGGQDRATPPFRRILIANRGEIAIRVIRTCRELGIESIAVYSEADADALHVRQADRALRIGPATPAESYLSIVAIVEAARRSRAEAIHPGYGFLSESAAFAAAVAAAGIVFIGPPAETLATLGDKLAARRAAVAAGVPIVPGLLMPVGDPSLSSEALEEVGFPALLKAAAGGGGRGMRRVDHAEQVEAARALASREAEAAFGDGTLYLERLVSPARHIEVQLLGDRFGGLAVLGERECSVQRRHQKLVEESPSPAVTPELRTALAESARRIASGVAFENAATVEFLVDADGNHYFLEMNTRLQVEHGVTEAVTGLDLVAWQIRVAAGDRLPPEVLQVQNRGHAIEARVYAEDPHDGFRPAPGRVMAWQMPAGPGIRVDAGISEGSLLPTEYDPLLAKLVVHAPDRASALARLRRALEETLIGGVQTDLSFLRWLLDEPGFAAGEYDTGLIEEAWVDGPPLGSDQVGLAAFAAREARLTLAATLTTFAGNRPERPADRPWAAMARREAVERLRSR
ncbi:MAG: acetyl-CoA carboxylase biotin carboxylase subunit [Chloroflexi bacterium]|nr:MAG: acetyl-CoA carboxylase biotin carboxylase subunit [Chloroflexota bacterium]